MMSKGKSRNRIKVKKKKLDSNNLSSRSESPLEGNSSSPKRKVTSSSIRSRSERSSYATEDMYSVSESNATFPDPGDLDSSPFNQNGSSPPTVNSAKKPRPIIVKNISLENLMKAFEAGKINTEFKLCRIGIKIIAASKTRAR